jgi:hypothetical protein
MTRKEWNYTSTPLYTFIVCAGTILRSEAIPLQACKVSEVSRRMMFPDLKTIGT